MDPKAYFLRYLDHAATAADHRVWLTLVTNQGASGSEPRQQPAVASYGLADLDAVDGDRLAGRATLYFSDRRRPGAPIAPFDPTRTEDVTVEVGLGKDGIEITLTNHNWADARQTLTDVHLHDGVLTASGASMGNQTPSASYVISLGQSTAP